MFLKWFYRWRELPRALEWAKDYYGNALYRVYLNEVADNAFILVCEVKEGITFFLTPDGGKHVEQSFRYWLPELRSKWYVVTSPYNKHGPYLNKVVWEDK